MKNGLNERMRAVQTSHKKLSFALFMTIFYSWGKYKFAMI
jgi:hypothetical protein